jgi:hypothetical protein
MLSGCCYFLFLPQSVGIIAQLCDIVPQNISFVEQIIIDHNVLIGRRPHGDEVVDIRGIPCAGVLESVLRQLARVWRKRMSVCIVAVEGGYLIRAVLDMQKSGVFVMAEHSQQMRIFKKADTAIAACRRMGLDLVTVEL